MVVMAFDLVHLFVMFFLSPIADFIFFINFLVLVAFVEILVLLPVLEADPAELVSAASTVALAGHVVASLILLYVFVALWTGLGIDQNPFYIFTL